MGPYPPTYQLQITVVLPTKDQAEWLAREMVHVYGGEAVVWERIGERPDLTLTVVTRVGERP